MQDASGSLERSEIVRALIKSIPELNGRDEDWLLGTFSAIWCVIDPDQDGKICCVDIVVWVAYFLPGIFYFQARKRPTVAVNTLPGTYLDLACCRKRGFPESSCLFALPIFLHCLSKRKGCRVPPLAAPPPALLLPCVCETENRKTRCGFCLAPGLTHPAGLRTRTRGCPRSIIRCSIAKLTVCFVGAVY